MNCKCLRHIVFFISLGIPVLGMPTAYTSAQAQTVTTDGSVGTSVTNTGAFFITEGTLRSNADGSNSESTLFHSFDTFSPESSTVIFDLRDSQNSIDTSTVNTIISRVTGSSDSFIDGFLSINQDSNTPTPDLFLINPNGIEFGFGAFVNVPGSFVASTAERVLFDGGASFNALDAAPAPLLTVSTPVGLQMGANPADISSSGTVYTSGIDKTSALIGNNIIFFAGGLYAESGHTEIGSIGSQAQVNLTPSSTGWAFDYSDVDTFSDISLFSSTVNPSNRGSGSFQLVGNNIDLIFGSQVYALNRGDALVPASVIKAQESLLIEGYSDPAFGQQGSLVYTYALADGDAGDLIIESPVLQLANRGQISSFTGGAGNAGDVILRTTTLEASRLQADRGGTGVFNQAFASANGSGGDISIETEQFSLNNGAQIVASTLGTGDTGSIVVQAKDMTVGGSLVGSSTVSVLQTRVEEGATGNGGELVINAEQLEITGGGRLSAETFGLGDAGNVGISAERIELVGASPTENLSSGIYADVNNGAEGDGGNITLTADELIMREGGRVAARSRGLGDAGTIAIDAGTIVVTGATPLNEVASLISATVEEAGQGNAGNIDVRADSLTLSDGGQLLSETRAIGNAGNITLNVDDVVVTGTVPSGATRSVVSTAATDTAQGNGGRIIVNSENLTVGDRGELFSAISGTGDAGDIAIETGSLTISSGGKIQSASVGNGDSGNIDVNAARQIEITGATPTEDSYSGIYALVGEAGNGNAGNITLNTEQLIVRNGGQITASVIDDGVGDGGDIIIGAEIVLVNGDSPLGTNPSLIASNIETGAEGDAGDIVIVADSLTLSEGGQLLSGTDAFGNGGNIIIEAQDIELTGVSSSDEFPSIISARVDENGQGNAGNVSLNTNRLSILAGGLISSSTLGNGNSGSIEIKAEDVVLAGTNESESRRSFLVSSVEPTGEGNAGNIRLDTRSLQVQEGAQLSSSTFGNGNAGNIVIAAQDVLIQGSSDSGMAQAVIRSNAESGRGNAGDIDINTRTLTLSEGGQLISGTNNNSDGGNINVISTDILVTGTAPTDSNVSLISTAVTLDGQGNAGDIGIEARNITLQEGGQIFSGTLGLGNSGNIVVRAEEILIAGETRTEANTSRISTAVQSSGRGNAGDIDIKTGNLELRDGGQILSGTANVGNGGNLNLVAQDIVVSGTSSTERRNSLISTATTAEARGDAGRLTLSTDRLTIDRGGAVRSRTAGLGNAGELSITAEEILRIEGRSASGDRASQISAEVANTATGTGSNVALTTERLEVLNGAEVTTGTVGNGVAGNITANVGSLLVQGRGEGENQPSRLTASSGSDFAAGSLLVTARDGVAVREGAELSVSSLFAGDAGNLGLSADSVRLVNDSRIEARTTAGNQGNIDLAVNQLILLDQNSQLTTDATNTATGGNITLEAPIIVGNRNSDITANAVEGAGGNIAITTQGLFGLQFREQLTPANDITASSEAGLNGNVVIDLPVIDPTNGLTPLPVAVLDPSDQIATGCIADQGANFIATGRGGVPIDPSQGMLEGASLQAFELSPEGATAANGLSTTPTDTSTAVVTHVQGDPSPLASSSPLLEKTVFEASAWGYNEDGDVQLVTVPVASSQRLAQSHATSQCLGGRVG